MIEAFKQTLEEFGVKLSTDLDIPHILTYEHSIIGNKLLSKLSQRDFCDNFTHQMVNCLQNEDFLRHAISKTVLRKAPWKTEKISKSIMHIFLKIELLQNAAMGILLETFPLRVLDHDVAFITDALESFSHLNKINNEAALANCLIESLDVADLPTKYEIIGKLPNILWKINIDVAQRLFTLVEEDEKLAELVLKCLGLSRYSHEVKTSILIFIYNRLLTPKYYKVFPTVLDLLLHQYDEFAMPLEKTRPTMDKIMAGNLENVKQSLHALLITAITPCSPLYGVILKFHVTDEAKPIDIYLLLLLYASNKLKCKAVEALIKKRVKSGYFTLELWKNLFHKYFSEQSLSYFYRVLLEISLSLIDSQNQANIVFGDVGILIFKRLFTHEHCDNAVRRKLLETVYMNIKLNPKSKNIDIYLKMLLDLSRDKKLEEQSDTLMTVYVSLYGVLSPKLIKYVFEIICENIINDEHSIENLRGDISKLLTDMDQSVMKKGVIGAIILAKHQSKQISPFPSTSSLNDSTLTQGASVSRRQAICMLDFAREMCSESSGPLGLYHDELAMSLGIETNDKILYHLHSNIQSIFEETYISAKQESLGFRVPLKIQFDLNNPEEMEQPLFVNIGELVQNQLFDAQTSIAILPAIFRFLRKVTGFRLQGKLDDIDALLGCGVLLPNVEDIDIYGQADLPIVANCLFHCINWFRELVSAFVPLSDGTMRLKVIQRLEHIILLEDKLEEVMSNIPDHKLPQSYFYDEGEGGRTQGSSSGFIAGSSKRARYDSTINITSTSTHGSKSLRSVKKRYFDFREMDSDVMTLLRYPVISANLTTTQAQSLRSKQFQFILRDSIGKLASIMNLRPRAETLHDILPGVLLGGIERLMPYIHKQFRLFAKELFTLIENNDKEDSDVFFTPHCIDLKISFDLVVNLYKIIFSWTGFQLAENKDLFHKFLKYFHAAETSVVASQQSQVKLSQMMPPPKSQRSASLDTSTSLSMTACSNDMKKLFIQNMSNYKGQCLVLSSAAALLELLNILRGHMAYQHQDVNKIIVQTANQFLKRSWHTLTGTLESGKEASDNLQIIITSYLENARVKTLNGIVNTLTLEVKDLTTSKPLKTFRAIGKSNVHIFIKCICNVLHSKLRSELCSLLPSDQLTLWQHGTHTLQSLIDVAKTLGDNKNLLIVAKATLSVINLFLNCGFTTIETCLRKKPDGAQTLFTTWEGITRFMHRLMCEATAKRIKSYFNIIPLVRAALETFVQKVKKVLVRFKCTVAFFEGALVNKNLDGEEILTQCVQSPDQDIEEEDVVDEEDIFERETVHSQAYQSASEIF